MASLHRKKNSNCWYARVKLWNEIVGDWQWKARSTGVEDNGTKENEDRAQKIGDEMEKVSMVAKTMTRSSMDIDKFANLTQTILESAGVSVERGGDWPVIKDYLESYIKKLEPTVAKKTVDNYTTAKNQFCNWLNKQGAGEAKMDWLTTARAGDFYYESTKSLSPKTIRERIKFLAQVYDYAETFNGYPTNPFRAVKKLMRKSGSKKGRDELNRLPFSLQEVRSILDYLDSLRTETARDWHRAVRIGLMVGCRLGDAVGVHSDDIEDGGINYVHDKTGKMTNGPMMVDKWRKEFESIKGYLCPSLYEHFCKYQTAKLSTRFTKIVEKSGVEQKYHVFDSGRRVARKTFHSLRHTLRSAMIAKGGSDAQADLLLGHSPGQGQVYTHVDMNSMKQLLKSALAEM